MSKQSSETNSELRITNFPSETHNQLNGISKQIGNNVSDFLRPKIRDFVNSFPDELKKKHDKTESSELKITGFSKKLQEELKNIAKNLGVDVSSLLKPEIYRITKANKKK